MEHFDLFIIGGGAAGIAAARAAYAAYNTYEEAANADENLIEKRLEPNKSGEAAEHILYNNAVKEIKIALADKGDIPGGILRQCVHKGFGHELTGVEYADFLLEDFPEEITIYKKTNILSVREDKTLLLTSKYQGIKEISFDHLILATGCLEIPIGALPIAGSRPSGIYTAGEMQALMNLENVFLEGPVVILGSGDLGLIMAEAIYEKGIPVTLVEQKSTCGGLARNRKRIESGEIPVLTGSTIREVCGKEKIEAVVVVQGDDLHRAEQERREKRIPCKTLLIAAGLRPDRSLIHGLEDKEWITLCGNCHKVHPMVEGVVAEGEEAGRKAVNCKNEEI